MGYKNRKPNNIPKKTRKDEISGNIKNENNYSGKIINGIMYQPWDNQTSRIYYPNTMILNTIRDGSCFFHALVMSFFMPYQTNTIDRCKFIREFRKNLSDELSNKINGNITYYNKISEGSLQELSKTFPNLSLENMKEELDSSSSISDIYNEFISDAINRDIYLLNYETKDIYMTGTNINNLYKDRPSSIILYRPGHYELIGVLENNDTLRLSFDTNHPFILQLKRRIIELTKI